MIFCSNSVYDPICLHALSKINTNLIDWLFDFSNLIIHTNFLCDRPLPEPHDMLDPTLKVRVNYNRERERRERREREEREKEKRGEKESPSILTFIWYWCLRKEGMLSFFRKKSLDGGINRQNGWKTVFLNKSIKK